MSNQQRLWGSTLRSPIASPHLSGLTTCLAWAIQLNALMSKFYAEPVLCLKDEHRLRPPCRVAAEASSAALPSCQLLQLLPAAWKPAGISGCGRAGQRQEHRYCALPKAPPPAGPIFSGSSSYNTAVCFNSFSGQMGSNSYGRRPLVNVAQCTFPPSSYPDNRWVAASTNRRLALAALPPSQAYFSLSSCQPALCATIAIIVNI